jgi:ATP-dependent Clp protease ATP-binding subunit ClpC
MSIATSGTIHEVLSRAADFARNGNGEMSTGYLLLAILTGTGAAARTLTLRGLTETKLRNAIRNSEPEPSEIVDEVIDKANSYAESLGVNTPSAIHVLASIATVRRCEGHLILVEGGLNVDVIRNQALRNMTTSLTREHGPPVGNDTATRPGGDFNRESLPLPDQLRAPPLQFGPVVEKRRQGKPASGPTAPPGLSQQHPPSNMGLSLEQAQQKTRALRSESQNGGQASPAPVESAPPDVQFEHRAVPISPEPARSVFDPLSRFDLSPSEFPTLAAIGRNITADAARGHIEEIIGREREMERIADVLNKRRANSPCLVGAPGVGKTAIVEGLACKLVKGEAPGLEDRILLEVRSGDLLSGTSLRGALSERFDALREEVVRSEGRVVLFFDEIHSLLASPDGAEAVQDLKVSLGRGEMPCIAATTGEEYSHHVESDPALARRFTVIEIDEPDQDEAVRIIEGAAPSYAEHHQLSYTPEALKAAVKLSSRYVHDRALPDKALALLDLAGARVRRSNAGLVSEEDIADVLAEQIGVPAERLSASDQDRLLNLESDLAERIIGHRHVLDALGETLRRNAAGFRSGRPIGSVLFLGPTGVGKTETAKVLADLLFTDQNSMIRLDMTEFSEAHAVARMIGAPPGYVGHEDGGQFTEAVRKRPYCLILLDEIEKAHRDVLQILLQVLDYGRLTDGKGRAIVFENTVIVMTSNLGSDMRSLSSPRRRVGFSAGEDEPDKDRICESILGAAREALAPELWNRIDEPLVFAPLTRQEVGEIAMLMLNRLSKQLETEQGVSLEVGEGAVDTLIAAGGFDPELGARPMRRTIQRLIEGPVAKMVLSSEVIRGDRLVIEGDGEKLTFENTTSDRTWGQNPPLDI